MSEANFHPWPINCHAVERLHLRLDADDKIKVAGRGQWRANITDQNTGKRYRVRGASCGLPHCMCDAVVVKELP